MKNNILATVALCIVFGLGIFATKQYYSWGETVSKQSSQVLLERIKTVTKLVAVEGYFSEVYTHEDYYNFDLSPFRKKALLRVKAKVAVGYDLENMKVETLEREKKIVIKNIPEPKVLSIDHDIDYYDIQEGTFNSFSEQELTDLNKRAKEFIEKKAASDELGLRPAAAKQMNEMLESIRIMVESAGYTLEYSQRRKEEEDKRIWKE